MGLLSRILHEALTHYLLHLALLLSGASLLYWRTFCARGIPSFTRADYIELDSAREEWLITHGYGYTGTYCVNVENPIKFVLNSYTSADGMKACAIIKCIAQATAVTGFTSRCTPFFVLCLDDFNGGEALGYAPYKAVFHSRAESIAELSDLHDKLLDECRIRNVFPSPLPASDEGVENMICKGAKRDLE